MSDEVASDKVIVDDFGAGYKATKHLVDVGCKRIAILSTPDYVNVAALRTMGYKRALEDSNMLVEDDLICRIDDTSDINDQISRFMNNDHIKFDGILGVNEIYAATAIKIAKEKGIHIPNELAVVGFTDGLISLFSTPPLSTVKQHGVTIGEQATELLLDRIQHKDRNNNFKQKIISTDLIVRKSSQKSEDVSLIN